MPERNQNDQQTPQPPRSPTRSNPQPAIRTNPNQSHTRGKAEGRSALEGVSEENKEGPVIGAFFAFGTINPPDAPKRLENDPEGKGGLFQRLDAYPLLAINVRIEPEQSPLPDFNHDLECLGVVGHGNAHLD